MTKCDTCKKSNPSNCTFCPPDYSFYEPKHEIPPMPKDEKYKNLFPLIIDSRELHGDNAEIASMFTELGFDVQVKTLEIGDYQYGEIGVERKMALGDFTKLDDVFRKVDELKMAYPHPILVVEGTLDDAIEHANLVYHRDMEPTMLGAVASLTVRKIPPIFCGSRSRMVRIMAGIFRKQYDGKDRSIQVNALRPTANIADVKLRVIAGIEGVGKHRAEKLIEHFGSIENIIKSTPEKLMKVDGIGSITAKKILEALR